MQTTTSLVQIKENQFFIMLTQV